MTTTTHDIRIGYAEWHIPLAHARLFGAGASNLERYATRLMCSEINSSFYKALRPATYKSWAATVPDGFQFAVKMPKQITHISRLGDLSALGYLLTDVDNLGGKAGPLLMQLPAGFVFDAERVRAFLLALRFRFRGSVVCEPRHTSWFAPEAEQLLAEYQVARVAADPAPLPAAALPGGWPGLAYYRLHGTPRMYYSAYSDAYLDMLAQTLIEQAGVAPVWCIFDNTAAGAAAVNALGLLERIQR